MSPSALLVCVSIFCVGLAATLAGIFTPGWTVALGLDPGQIGLLYGLQTAVATAASLAAGRLADRRRAVPVIYSCLVGLGLGVLCLAFARGLPLLALGLVLQGSCASGLVITAAAWLVASYRNAPARPLGAINFAFAAGAIAGPGLLWIAGPMGKGSAAMLIAALPLVTALGLLWTRFSEAPPAPASASGPAGFSVLLSSRATWVIGFAVLAYGGIEGGLVAWLPLYVSRSPGVGMQPGLWTSWFYLFLTAGRLVWTQAAGRWRTTRFLVAAGASLVPPAAVWLALGPGDWVLAPVALLGLACAGIYPAFQAELAVRFPGAMGLAGVWLGLFGSVGSVIWPGATGRLLSGIGIAALPGMLVLQAVLVAVLVAVLAKMPPPAAVPWAPAARNDWTATSAGGAPASGA